MSSVRVTDWVMLGSHVRLGSQVRLGKGHRLDYVMVAA